MTIRTHKTSEMVIIYDPNIPDYNKTPFAVKKAERAKALVAKYGLPKVKRAKKAR
jgi:hypothetical protein